MVAYLAGLKHRSRQYSVAELDISTVTEWAGCTLGRHDGPCFDGFISHWYHPFMLNPAALQLLSELPPSRLPFALKLFADYDFSVPRILHPDLLDVRYEWKPGTAFRVLLALTDCGLLVGSRTLRLASMYCWKPSDLAAQWEREERATARESVVS